MTLYKFKAFKLHMMNKKLLLTLSVFVFSAEIFAQANAELKTIINNSFKFFPNAIEAENTIRTAEEKLVLTKLNNSPSIAAYGGYSYAAPVPEFEFGPNKVQFQPHNNFNTNVSGLCTIYDFGRLKANIEKSKADLVLTKHNVESLQFQLANQISSIYYNIIYIKKAITIQDTILAFLGENKKIVETKLNNGDALKFDVLNIQASIDNEENRKVDLSNLLQKQLYLLEYSSGYKSISSSVFDFNSGTASNLLDAVQAKEIATKNNIDFLIAKDKMQQAISDLEIIKLQEKPTINSNAALGFRNGFAPDIFQFRFNYLAGVGINIPLYTGGKMKQSVKLQQTLIKQNELAIKSLEATHLKDIQQTLKDIATNKQRIYNTKGQIEQAQYAQRLASVRFTNGVGTNLELINASSNVQRALLTKLQYEFQLCLANVELAKLLGERYW